MEVDWSGPTMRLVDPATGEVRKVYLFVACLPFSRYSYVEPTLDMKQDTWLLCHVHAFSFLGGATPCIVPDNLRTGVTAHPRAGEPVLNAAYEELAAHYGSAVIPARVRRPRDKPSAENEVWAAATYVIAALRDEVFTDMAALRAAVARRVAEHNDAPFAKREGSRREVFEEVERPLLRPLPAEPFEVCVFTLWKRVRKYGAYATGITQNVDDLLQSHTARTMLANSEFIVMLNQASTDRLELAKLLNISDTQLSYITNVDAGHGLIKVGSSLVPFANKFPKNTKLYKLMTTKPGEGA